MFLSGLDQTRHTIFLGSKASCSAPLWSYASYVCEAAINNLPKKQRCDRLPSLPNSIKSIITQPNSVWSPSSPRKKNWTEPKQHPMFPRLDLDRPLGSTVSSWAWWWHPRPRAKAKPDVMKNDVMWFCMIFSCSWIVWTSVFSLCLGSFGNDSKAQKDASLKSVDFLLYVFHIYIYRI